jgi:hypothetical protein
MFMLLISGLGHQFWCVDRIIDGSSSNNLIEVIMNALLKGGG